MIKFEDFLAARFLLGGRRKKLVLFMTLVSLFGIFLSVFSFNIIYSVMHGFEEHLKTALIGFDSHITLKLKQTASGDQLDRVLSFIAESREVDEVNVLSEFEGLIQMEDGKSFGVTVRGVREVDNQQGRYKIHKFEKVDEVGDAEALPALYLGEEIYTRIALFPGYTEKVRLVNPFGEIGPAGEIEPIVREYEIGGFLSTGFYDFDAYYGLVPYQEMDKLVAESDKKILVHLFLKNEGDVPQFTKQLKKEFPDLGITSWREKNKSLVKAMNIERLGMSLLLGIIIFVTSINVFGLISLFSFTKLRDFAVLKSMGLSFKRIKRVLYRVSFLIGLSGALLAVVASAGVVLCLEKNPLELPQAYYLDSLPISFNLHIFLLSLLITPLITFLITCWPAYRLSRLSTMEALRDSS